MTVFHAAAFSAALAFGLILASALAAGAGDAPVASAQMNRHLYPPRVQPEAEAKARMPDGPRAGELLSGRLRPAVPVAQMNRHLYSKR